MATGGEELGLASATDIEGGDTGQSGRQKVSRDTKKDLVCSIF